jgi:exosortase F-associated protein
VVDQWRLMINLVWRYVFNSLISVGIIALIFKNREYVKFSGFFLMFASIVLIIGFSFFVKDGFSNGYLLPFYIRRFIIHPIFLFLLLLAFYYQKLRKKA